MLFRSGTAPEVPSVQSEELENNNEATTSPLPEVPVNEELPTTTSLQTEESNLTPSTESINGGRSHYVHSTNKKATTHRHHKRRNRHQTLRNYKK